MRKLRILPILLLIVFVGWGLFGQDSTENGEETGQENVDETALTFEDEGGAEDTDPVTGSSVWTYVSAVLVLGLVVGAIYLLFYFLKKASSVTFRENDDIRIIATKTLSNTKQLHVIKIGNEFSLIGTGENGITHIKEITDSDTMNQLKLSAAQEQTGERKGFQEILSSILPGLKKSSSDPGENSNTSNNATQESSSFLKSQQDRLKKL